MQLAAEDKVARYTKYAIGEIVLVVIGILIALQINNWNEKRIQHKESVSLSERLVIETKKNQQDLSGQIVIINRYMEEAQKLLSLFGPDYQKIDDKLMDSLLFGFISSPIFDFNSATLNEALNTGKISLIESDTIRAFIYDIPQQMERVRNFESELIKDIEQNLMPFLYRQISLRQIDYRFSSNITKLGKSKLDFVDNRELLANIQFENMVDNKIFMLESLIRGYNELNVTFENILEILEAESK